MVATIVTRCQKVWGLVRAVMIGLISFAFSTSIFANPALNNVAHGDVTVQQTQTTTTVNQASQKAIINWNSFNIGAGEHTHFNQPAGGVALNRISPTQGASQIWGQLSATGRIILVNPAGVFIGPNAFVNVGSLIASTRDITDQNFLNGIYRFDQLSAFNGAIVNQGTIVAAEHGLIALVGGAVSNEGVIQANLGKVVLASGEQFTMSFAGNDMISFAVDEAITQRAVDMNGNELADGVKNTGSIIADGGQILVHAKAAQGVLDNVINMEGIVQAQSVQEINGEIILSADTAVENVVRVAGKLDVSGNDAGESGGDISVLGYNILIDEGAELNASGETGGGNVRVGGNYLGQGPLPNANAVLMGPDSSIYADAVTSGDGGEIILWSDNYTSVWGGLYARGGSESGDGGLIETSSLGVLDVNNIREAITLSMHGETGTWLLDPAYVWISTTYNAPSTYSWNASRTEFAPASGVGSYMDILVSTIVNQLAYTTVRVTTTNTGTSGSDSGTIGVWSDIVYNSPNWLLLNADGIIQLNANIINNGAGYIYLDGPVRVEGANRTVSSAGAVVFRNNTVGASGSVWTSPYYLTIGGTAYLQQSSGTYGTTSTTDGGLVFNSNVIANSGATNLIFYGNFSTYGTFTATSRSINLDRRHDSGYSIIKLEAKSLTVTDGRVDTYGYINTSDNNITINSGGWLLGYGGDLIANDETITVNSGGSYTLSYGSETIGKLILNGGTVDGVSTYTLTTSQNYDVRSGNIYNVKLGGTIGLTKTTTGTVTISGNNTYTGSTTVTGGTLTLTGSYSTQHARMEASGAGAVLNLNGSFYPYDMYANWGGVINIGGYINQPASTNHNIYIYNGGTVNLNGSDRINDSRRIVFLATTGNTDTFNLNGYTETIAGVLNSNSTYSRILLGSGTLTLNTAGSDYSFSGAISGSGSIAKTGTGTLALSGNNTYTGSTTVSAGTLTITGTYSSQHARMEATGSGAILNLNGNVSPYDIYANTGGVINIGGALNTPASTNYRMYIYSNGTINLTASNVIADNRRIYYNNVGTNTFDIGNFSETIQGVENSYATSASRIVTGSGTLTFNTAGVDRSFLGVISGSGTIAKSGSGTMTLSGNNTYTGYTIVNASGGVLNINGTMAQSGYIAAYSNSTVNINNTVYPTYLYTDGSSAVINIGASGYIGDSTISDTHQDRMFMRSGGQINLLGNNRTDTVRRLIFDIGAGTFNMNGYSTTIGGIDVSSSTSSIIVNGGALTIDTGSGSYAFSGVISGSGNFYKSGTGTMTLSGSNTYTGTTNVSDGYLSITGVDALGTSASKSSSINVSSGATLRLSVAPTNTNTISISGDGEGSIGALYFDNDMTLSNNISISSFGDVGSNAKTVTLSGNISGVNFRARGGGTYTLTGANTSLSGYINMIDATIKYSAANNLGVGTTLYLSGTSTLWYTGSTNQEVNREFRRYDGDGGVFKTTGSGTITLAGSIINHDADQEDINLAGTGNGVITAIIGGGTQNLVKNDSGTWTLSGANTYTGITTISAGTLQIGNGSTTGTLGSNSVTNDAALVFNRSDAYDVSNAISGSGTVTQAGSGTLTLSGDNSYNGGTTLNAGTLSLNHANAIGSSGNITFGGGILQFTSNNSTDYSSRFSTAASQAYKLDTNGENVTLASALISSGGSLTKNGAGILTLSANNTYSGITTISAGILEIGNGGTAGTLGTGSVTNNAALSFNRSDDISVGNVISGTGSLTQAGTGILTLSNVNTYTGATTISNGTLKIGVDGAINSTSGVTLANLATAILDLDAFDISITSLTGNEIGNASEVKLGTGILTIGNSTTTYNGKISGDGELRKNGTGTLTLGGANTYTGGTTITGSGAISTSTDSNLGTSILSIGNGTLLVTDNITTSRLIQLQHTNSTFFVDSGKTLTLNGSVTDNGTFNKSGEGKLELTQPNNFTGESFINDGIVSVLDAEGLSTTKINIAATGTLQLNNGVNPLNTIIDLNGGNITSSGTVTLGGAINLGNNSEISNTGTLSLTGIIDDGALTSYQFTKSGAGTLNLSGVNTFNGGITLNDGGVIRAKHNSALGTGTVFIGNGTLEADADLNLSNTISLGASAYIGAHNDFTLTGKITGTGTLNKSGSGVLSLDSTTNDYSGATEVGSGTLRLLKTAALGNTITTSIVSGATLEIAFTTGTLLANTNQINLNGVGVDVAKGALFINSNNAQINNNIELGLDSYIGVASGISGTIDGTISEASAGKQLYKVGAGTLTLSPVSGNSMTGNVTLSSGKLFVDHTNALGTGTMLNLNGGTFGATTGVNIANNIALGGVATIGGGSNFTLSGTITGNYGLTFDTGTLALTNTVNVGSILADASLNLSSASITTATTQQYNNPVSVVDNVEFIGTSVNAAAITGTNKTVKFTVSNDSNINGAITGSGLALSKAGSGTLTLSGSGNTYTGNTTLSGGTLKANDVNRLSANSIMIMSSTATLDLNSKNNEIKGLTGGSSNVVTLGTGNLTIGASGTTYAGKITGAGGLIKNGSGTQTLSGTLSDYEGGTTITGGGTISISSNNNLGAATGTVTLDNGTLRVTGDVTANDRFITINSAGGAISTDDGFTLTLGSQLTGSGKITKNGTGTLSLGNYSDYAGGTDVNAGTVVVSGDNAALGSGTVTMLDNAILKINGVNIGNDISLLGDGSGSGALIGVGNATASGTLTLNDATTFGAAGSSDILNIIKPLNVAIALNTVGDGTVAFGGALDLTSLTAGSKVSLAGATVTTSGAQQYNNTLTLANNVTLSGTGVNLNTIVRDGTARSLTVNSTGVAVNFNGTVGTSVNRLSALSATTDTGNISFTNNIFTTGNVSLSTTTGSVLATSTGAISGGLLTIGAATGISLATGNSLSGLHATITGSGNLSFTNSGALDIALIDIGGNHATINNTGSITQSGIITANNATFNAGSNTINLGSNNAISGVVSFTNSGNHAVTFNNTTNTLTLGESTVGANTLAVTNTGNMVVANTITSFGGNINLTTLKPDSNERTLTVNSAINSNGGNITLTAANNSAGDATPLIVNSILNSGSGSGGTLTLNGGTALNLSPTVGSGNITLNGNGLDLTFGTINFTSNIGFFAARTITLNGMFSTTNGSNLTLTANGTGTGEGIVMNAGATISSTGSLTLNGNAALAGTLTTSGGNININGPSTLAHNTVVNAVAGNITFANSVSGAGKTLTLQNNSSAGGIVTFNGNVTAGDLVTFAQPYQVVLNGSNNTFSSHVNFENLNGVTLGNGNDTFTFSGGLASIANTTVINSAIDSGGAVTLAGLTLAGNSNINASSHVMNVSGAISGQHTLTLSSSNSVTLNGNVNIAGLTLDGGGNDNINSSSITTTGTQSYQNPVSLNNATVALNGSNVYFGNILSANPTDLTVGASGTVTFGGNVTAKTMNVTGNLLNFGSNSIETFGNQSYSGSVTANGTLLHATSYNENNKLTFDSGGTQLWVMGNGSGSISGSSMTGSVNYTNMKILNGGTSSNTFKLMANSTYHGIINGGSANTTNTIDAAAYTNPVTLETSTALAGKLKSENDVNIQFTNISNVKLNSAANNVGILDKNGGNTLYVDSNYSGYTSTGITFESIKRFIAYGSNNTVVHIAATINNIDQAQAFVTGSSMEFIGFQNYAGSFITTQQVSNTIIQSTKDVSNLSSVYITTSQPYIINTPEIDIAGAVIAITNQLKELNISVSPDSTEALARLGGAISTHADDGDDLVAE